MKKILFIIIGIIVLCCQAILAQQVSSIEAVRAAANMINSVSDNDFSETDVQSIYTKTAPNGAALIHEILFTDGTTVFVSGNKACIPILGFIHSKNTQSGIHLNNYEELPDGLKFFIDNYCEQIEYCNENPTLEYNLEWSLLLKTDSSKIKGTRGVSPLLTTEWGQSISNDDCFNAYNYFVQECDSYRNCPVGCVATAMGQIIKYWSGSINIPFKCSQYDWNNMPDQLIASNNSNYTTQRNAVAQLLYDCAISVNMDFCRESNVICSKQGSYANSGNVPPALITFGLSGDNNLTRKSDYSQTQWETKIKNDLNNGKPIYYSGGGHAFVCDGYGPAINNVCYFHFNWGWRGNSNGYFTTSNINPINGSDTCNFTIGQSALFNIQPAPCWENIIMECNKTFSSIATYMSAVNKIENYFHTFAFTGGYAELTAGEEIFLTEGFSVNEGTNFLAEIESCSGTAKGDYWQYYEREDDETLEKIHESSLSAGIILHPNPTSGTVNIILPDKNHTIRQIEVRNMLGTSVLEKANMQGNTLDVSSLPAGVYIVRVVTTEGKEVFAKLVKK